MGEGRRPCHRMAGGDRHAQQWGHSARAGRGCLFSDLARKDVCLIGQHPPLFHGQRQWKPGGRENFSSLPSLARVPVFLFPNGSGEGWEVALSRLCLFKSHSSAGERSCFALGFIPIRLVWESSTLLMLFPAGPENLGVSSPFSHLEKE